MKLKTGGEVEGRQVLNGTGLRAKKKGEMMSTKGPWCADIRKKERGLPEGMTET